MQKKVSLSTLPTVKLSGEVIIGGKKKWLTLGTEGIEVPAGIVVLIDGSESLEATPEDVAKAVSSLMEKMEEVIVAQMSKFAGKVKQQQVQL